MTRFFNLFLCLFLYFSGIHIMANPIKIELNKDWQFRQGRLSNWYPATVPGTVHTDLLNDGKIEDPFYRLNEREMQWIDKEDWVYRTTFTLSPEMMKKDNIDLFFEGLDTYCDVSLNGTKILSADNMFREWRISAKKYLKEGNNVLEVYFHSPIKVDIPKWDSIPYHYEAGNDQSENGGLFNKKVSIFARKAGYHYGWDWGPRLVTSGIWRPVRLEAWDKARIDNVFVRQSNVTKSKAEACGIVEIEVDDDIPSVQLAIYDEAGGKILSRKTVALKRGTNKVELPFTIKNPRLWWCNGLGNPAMYKLSTRLSVNGSLVDTKENKVGFRSIKLVHKPDKYGQAFYFELNGVKVFMKGTNYIPQDVFLPRVTPEQYKKTIQDAVDVNMNMIRVWGGGIYENNLFYDLCDEKGLLVWQDFMFACNLYPAEGAFLENIRREAIDNVKRLRNHPCIALWCGNNECNDAWFNWGYKRRYHRQNPAWEAKIWKQFNDQYFDVLPKVVAEYDPDASYTPSSPFGLRGQGADDHNGDLHYWDVWQGRKPVSEFNRQKSRFFSEYGFQSFPDIESVKRYAPEAEDRDITSDVMMSHQRGGELANKRMEKIMLEEYRKPKDFASFLYMSQILQGDVIKTAMEAHRRQKPYCWGSLVWQHNDCWPVASWSGRDYYGRWKAQHYFTRKSFADVLVSPVSEDNGKTVQIYVVSDRLKYFNGTLEVEIRKFDGTLIHRLQKPVKVAANSSASALTVDIAASLKGVSASDVYLWAQLQTGNQQYSNVCFLLQNKDLHFPKPEITKNIKSVEGGYDVTLESRQFARAVWISNGDADASFSDNYMDLLPGKPVTVRVKTTLPSQMMSRQLQVVSVADATL